MAAVLIPRSTDLQVPVRRPELRLVPGLVRDGGAPTGRGRTTRTIRAHAPAGPDQATYRRRRLLAGLLGFTLVVAGVVALGRLGTDPSVHTMATVAPTAPAAAPPVTDAAAGPAVYVVRPGDTLWGIARKLQPEGDIRTLVDELSSRAGGAGIQIGQRIVLDGLSG